MTTSCPMTNTNPIRVVEAYRLDRYDNVCVCVCVCVVVVEAYRLDRYDNTLHKLLFYAQICCRSLSFG